MDLTFANSRMERAYFFRADQDLIRALHERDQETHEAELQAQHWMKCPKCGHDLRQTRLSNLTVERCTGCDGIFFDKEDWREYFDAGEPQHNFIETLHTLLAGDQKA